MKTAIINGTLLTPFKHLDKSGLIYEDGKITHLFEGDLQTQVDNIIDAKGMYVSPGFIDIHNHGGGGYEFLDGTVEAFDIAGKFHLRHGATSILPTLSACPDERLFSALDAFREAKKQIKNGPDFLGVHLEGPYFCLEQKGAQDPRYIKSPEPEHYKKILNYSNDIIRWSSAPELPGALELADVLNSKGILCAIAHSSATYQQVVPAFERGYTHVTHFYSACSTVRRINAFRYMGVVESAYAIDEMTVEIIADGCHLLKELLQLIFKLKPWDKICLITDSIRCAGEPEGRVSFTGSKENGMEILIEDGVAKLADRSAFAGSIATADVLVRNVMQLADIPILEAVRMITYNPAEILSLHNKKGVLAPNLDADICIFDDNINIKTVISRGEVVHNS